MIRIKVEYDKYNRVFKLVDKEFGSALVDGAVYEIPIAFMIDGDESDDVFATVSVPLAHA